MFRRSISDAVGNRAQTTVMLMAMVFLLFIYLFIYFWFKLPHCRHGAQHTCKRHCCFRLFLRRFLSVQGSLYIHGRQQTHAAYFVLASFYFQRYTSLCHSIIPRVATNDITSFSFSFVCVCLCAWITCVYLDTHRERARWKMFRLFHKRRHKNDVAIHRDRIVYYRKWI